MPGDVSTLAIDVGATRTRVALVHGGRVAQRAESPTSKLTAPSGLGDGLVEEARNLLAKASAANGSRAAVGVSLAAAVDDRGDVVQERDFGIPAGGTLREALATAFELPVAVNNDANLAALAEHELGAARGHDSAAVITLGSNIGLGLIPGGSLHRGAHGMAGEAGLLLVPAISTSQRGNGRRRVDAGRFGSTASAAPEGYAWIEELVGGRALAAAGSAHRDPSVRQARILTREAFADPALRPLG